MRETVKSGKWRVEEKSTHTSAWNMDDMTRTTPWANVTCDTVMSAGQHEKMWRVRVFCSHTPSVAADCYQLWTILLQLLRKKTKFELHQFSFHCHHEVLEEEEDECHLWYWWKGIGKGLPSPESRWRRFISVTAFRKSDRSFIGAFLPDLFSEVYQFFLISLVLLRGWATGMVFLRQFVHLDDFSSVQQFWVANHDILNLVESDREFH